MLAINSGWFVETKGKYPSQIISERKSLTWRTEYLITQKIEKKKKLNVSNRINISSIMEGLLYLHNKKDHFKGWFLGISSDT